MTDDPQSERRPWRFFGLVFVLSLPLYLLSPFVHVSGLPKNGPILDFVGAFMPMVAAVILTGRAAGRRGVRELLGRAVDFRRIPARRWYLVMILLMPAVYLLTAVALWVTDVRLPVQPSLSPLAMLVFVPVFVLAATGEELGWTAYATDPLRSRYGPLAASLIIALPWWAWHLYSIISSGQTSTLVVLGFFATIGFRIIYVWLYGATGSVASVIILHAMTNVAASYLPMVPTSAAAPVLLVVAAVIAVSWTVARRRSRVLAS
ncbi:CPBP family intramembrane glutamic endopeptidase [Kribbella sp. CA-247076]|uniref:CPBP family intramembrane glutamic endopeptidase n=1 Tax=Kribbella sp. CA-247076 TaxID=3239941 RepID=UPI003D8BD290